jgi:hypothetical protein
VYVLVPNVSAIKDGMALPVANVRLDITVSLAKNVQAAVDLENVTTVLKAQVHANALWKLLEHIVRLAKLDTLDLIVKRVIVHK